MRCLTPRIQRNLVETDDAELSKIDKRTELKAFLDENVDIREEIADKIYASI